MAWHQITYRTYVCRCQVFLPALLSAPQLVETWSSLVPDDVSGIEHSASPVLRRGTVCCRTFVLHQHYVLSKSAQDSSIFSFISIIYSILRSVCCTCSDFMDMLQRLISCRIIIIIIIISPGASDGRFKCGNRSSGANFLIEFHSNYESTLLSF